MHKYMIDAIKGLLKVNQKDDCIFPFFGYVFYLYINWVNVVRRTLYVFKID